MSSSFDAYLQTITQDGFLQKVVDTILNSNVLTVRLVSKQEKWSGEQLKVPFKYQKSTTGGSFALTDTFTTTKVNTRQKMAFDPKYIYQNITLMGPEVSVNNISKTQVVSLLKTEMESAQQDMLDTIGGQLYGYGAGNDMLGIQGIVDDATFLATYGEMARATYTTLNSNVTTVAGPLTIGLMASAHSAAKLGNQKPTIGITTESIWNDYEELVQPTISANYNIMGGAKVTRDEVVRAGQALGPGQVGFDALMYRGMPLVADDKCNSGEMYFLNEDFLSFYGLPAEWYTGISLSSDTLEGGYYSQLNVKTYGFSWSGWKEPTNQYARCGQILLMGNLIGKSPRTSSKLESLT
jgi:hypothetical protein